MAATYRALCAHGYADLTMQEIANEAGVSKAALHYHYDTKRALILSFLDMLSSDFEARLDDALGGVDAPADEGDDATGDADPTGDADATGDADPTGDTDATGDDDRDPGPPALDADEDLGRRLFAVVDVVMESPAEDRAFRTAMLELEAQAPYSDDIRERLTSFDAAVRDRLRRVLVAGSEAGVFEFDRDPAAEAAFLATIVHGAGARNVAFGASLVWARESLRSYLRDELLVDPDAHDLADVLVADPTGTGVAGGDDGAGDDATGRPVVDEPREVSVE